MSTSNFIIFNIEELGNIIFSKVNETSKDTLRLSIDGTKSFVSWKGETPEFISSLTTKSSIYSEEEILEILVGIVWKKEIY